LSHLAQLSADEIEDRFHITGQRPVQFLLAELAEKNEPFTVHFNHGKEHFQTLLLAAQPASRQLIFDCSGSTEINRHFLLSEHNVFIGRPGGIKVQFSSEGASEMLYGGARALSVPLPKFVLRLQRRESFRIETPRLRPLQFFGRLPDGNLLNLPAHDISCTGIGLAATTLPETLSPGMSLGSSRFVIPDDKHDFFVETIVRHMTEQEGRGGISQWRIGLEFIDLGNAEDSRIQRYIGKIERERHELS
jgi:c-di-GMP-binding flagellar brake protein YcgR